MGNLNTVLCMPSVKIRNENEILEPRVLVMNTPFELKLDVIAGGYAAGRHAITTA